MSDFLVVVPEDPTWIKLSDTETLRLFAEVLSPSTIIDYINGGDYFNFSLNLRDGQIIGEEDLISEARLITTGNFDLPFNFYYKLG